MDELEPSGSEANAGTVKQGRSRAESSANGAQSSEDEAVEIEVERPAGMTAKELAGAPAPPPLSGALLQAARKVREELLVPIKARYAAWRAEKKQNEKTEAVGLKAAAAAMKKGKKPKKIKAGKGKVVDDEGSDAGDTKKSQTTSGYDGFEEEILPPFSHPYLRFNISEAKYLEVQRESEAKIIESRTGKAPVVTQWAEEERKAGELHYSDIGLDGDTNSQHFVHLAFPDGRHEQLLFNDRCTFSELPSHLHDALGSAYYPTGSTDRDLRNTLVVGFMRPFYEAENSTNVAVVRRIIRHKALWSLGENGEPMGILVRYPDMSPNNRHRACNTGEYNTMVNVSRCITAVCTQR